MEGRKVFATVIIGTASVFIIMALFVAFKAGLSSESDEPVGFSIARFSENQESQEKGRDLIEINNDELVKCCSFINELGSEDSCFVMKRYDCSYCAEACGEQ